MQGSLEQKQKDGTALLEKHRQEMEACSEQQAVVEERLALLQEQKQALQAEIEIVLETWQSLKLRQQELEYKREERRWRYGKGL